MQQGHHERHIVAYVLLTTEAPDRARWSSLFFSELHRSIGTGTSKCPECGRHQEYPQWPVISCCNCRAQSSHGIHWTARYWPAMLKTIRQLLHPPSESWYYFFLSFLLGYLNHRLYLSTIIMSLLSTCFRQKENVMCLPTHLSAFLPTNRLVYRPSIFCPTCRILCHFSSICPLFLLLDVEPNNRTFFWALNFSTLHTTKQTFLMCLFLLVLSILFFRGDSFLLTRNTAT